MKHYLFICLYTFVIIATPDKITITRQIAELQNAIHTAEKNLKEIATCRNDANDYVDRATYIKEYASQYNYIQSLKKDLWELIKK